ARGDPRARRTLEHPRRDGTAREVPRVQLALVPEEIRAPAARAVELAPLIKRHAGREIDVRLQAFAVGRQHAQQFRTDFPARRLDRLEPWESGALEELDR